MREIRNKGITPYKISIRSLCRNLLISLILVSVYRNLFLDLNDDVARVKSMKTISHDGFEIVEKENLEEYEAEGITYEHKKTGAEVFIVNWGAGNQESKLLDTCKEKVFGIFFRTPPTDSTGVAHIIEHSVLCGSRKYKTKEPFTNLLQGSLNTFLNAFTFPDRTGYGFASCNTKDFFNSMNVYLDAVFFPRAAEDPFVLAQEGWHLQPVNQEKSDEDGEESIEGRELNDSSSAKVEMKFQGVVYSEMSGVYSDVDQVMGQHAQTALFPDNTYRHDSGGNPAHITELTFEKFAEFYKTHYHPTNSKIFVSVPDNSDDQEILSILDSYLSEFEKDETKKTKSKIYTQTKKFTEPKFETHPYQAANSDEHHVLVSFLLNDEPMSQEELFALSVLDHLLLGTRNSKLYKSLSESGLGDVVISDGLEDELIQATYSVGLKGVKSENVKEAEKFILDRLQEIAKEGFTDVEMVAAINSLEFNLREFNNDNSKGVSFMFSTMAKWIYDQKPSTGTKFEDSLKKLKESLKNHHSLIFQSLIQKRLLNNTHRVTIEMFPDNDFERKEKEKEQERLEKFTANLNDEDMKSVIKFSEDLKARQVAKDSPEAIASIPIISVNDIDSQEVEFPISKTYNAFSTGITLVSHEIPSSGIVYIDLAVDISMVPFSVAMRYLPLFKSMMTMSENVQFTSEELTQEISMHTGGVGVSTLVSPVKKKGSSDNIVLGDNHIVTKLMIQGKSLDSPQKVNKLLSIYKAILWAKLDNRNLALEILRSRCNSIKGSIQSNGMGYAYSRVSAKLSATGVFDEQMNGVTSFNLCEEVLTEAENNWSHVLENLSLIRSLILKESTVRNGMIINLTGSRNALQELKDVLKHHMTNFPGISKGEQLPNYFTTVHPWVIEARKILKSQAAQDNEALIVPTKVNYVVSGRKMYKIDETIEGSAFVAVQMMNTDYLWNNVRVLGGAYGASGKLRLSDGFFAFTSYRDPNILKTLNFYDGAADNMLEEANRLKNDHKELEKYIISSVGSIDGGSLSANEIGWISFSNWLTGVNNSAHNKLREEILKTTPQDIENFANKLKTQYPHYSVAVVTSQASLAAVGEDFKFSPVNVIGLPSDGDASN